MRVQGRVFLPNYLRDTWDRVTGRADPDLPPRHLNISGDGPFREYGQNIVNLCVTHAGLQADDSVLDIGCGIGRTALALAKFLAPSGRYAGFDVIKFAIDWCQRHIAGARGGFAFVHADIYNKFYNPGGGVEADEYQFPFRAGEFSFALATSLFTHVLPSTASHYLRETGRVVSPGGRFLSTWFLLGGESSAWGSQKMQFPYVFEEYALHSLHAPEQAVAYRRDFVERSFGEAGLVIEAVYRGSWSGVRAEAASMQDVIVARRV
jgi:SAM-dependent methyltransferase